MGFLAQALTWWNGQTLGTRFHTWRRGERIGEDQFGNVYYQGSSIGPAGKPRRWVVYNGESEASRIPPDWHGWMHYTVDEPPTVTPLPAKPWEIEHKPNMTGTPAAYYPPGSLANPKQDHHGAPDYEPWTPE